MKVAAGGVGTTQNPGKVYDRKLADAHIDTWEAEFEAVPYSHGTPFRHALQEGLVREGEYMQIGIRGPVSGENDYEDAHRLGACIVTIHEVMEKGVGEILKDDTAAADLVVSPALRHPPRGPGRAALTPCPSR